MITQPKFGVAGFPVNFAVSEFRKQRIAIFDWLTALDLDWLELQCTYGVKMPEHQAIQYRDTAQAHGIGLSIHAPYYISLASQCAEIRQRSAERVLQAFQLATWLNSERIIFHPGGGHPADDRPMGIKCIVDGLNAIKSRIPANVYIYPEIGGRINQLGSLEEIIQICEQVDYARPCLDLAHLNARTLGTLTSTEAIVKVFDTVESRLGRVGLEQCHFHMYPIEFNANGEKHHKAFFNEELGKPFYPRAEHFIEAIKYKNINPVVICEAKNTQDEGAQLMKRLWKGNICLEQ